MYIFILEEVVITNLLRLFTKYFPEFLKTNKNILLGFKFEKFTFRKTISM